MTANPQPAVRVDARAEPADQWRKLALQFDMHRIDALSVLRGVVAGTVSTEDVRAFLAAPPRASALTPAPTEAGGVGEAAIDALTECEEYFDNRADADCDQDGFIPNKEMRLLSVVRTARAALSSTPAADAGWQDISTHKADAIKGAYSPHVLCAHAGKGWRRFGRYYLTLKRWYYSGTDERSQWAQVEGDEPTHWMPLPPLPAPPLNPEARDER